MKPKTIQTLSGIFKELYADSLANLIPSGGWLLFKTNHFVFQYNLYVKTKQDLVINDFIVLRNDK